MAKHGDVLALADDPHWFKDAIIYELHVRAFFDSTGDGVGDFRGLVQKLDYLQDLGVTALWLLPFYPSPLRDDGYDIADYTQVHPMYGTLADFKLFLREAHRRGLRVITEMVLNHNSDQHPWFQRARRAPPGSKERNFYVWSDTADKYREARIIFQDFEPSNWSWDPVAGAYYWHRFYHHQPDLNYDNPAVHRAMFKVLDFWLRMGIDGMRLDAVPYLYEREGTNCENLPETHEFLRALRRHVDANFKNRMLLAEANQWPEDSAAYFGRGDECHMAFHFPVMPRLFMATRMEDRFPIIDILQQTPAIPETCQWATFLRNHDELTLEMVTDEDRDYMYRVYAQDPQMRINLGIRRRLAPLLENNRRKIELLNGLLLSLPGTPVLYYGDEIGMGDNIYLGDRNGVRTPMQWSGERNAGFSRGNPQRLYFPVIIDPEYHYEAVNVETQQKNPHSLLWWMKRLIALRKRYKAFGRGTLEFLFPENHRVLAFVRRYEGQCILVVANLSRFVQAVELDLSAYRGRAPAEMLGRTTFPPIGDTPYFLTLGPYAFYWFSLDPMHVAPQTLPAAQDELPLLTVAGRWENVLTGRGRQALEGVLPAYLERSLWFAGKGRSIESIAVRDTIPMTFVATEVQVALIQAVYTEGDPETYLLPLACASGQRASALREESPRAVVARLRLTTREGEEDSVLYDPVCDRDFGRALLDALLKRRRYRKGDSEVVALGTAALRDLGNGNGTLPDPVLFEEEQGNSALIFGDRWILKVFRRLEEGIHPEFEVGRFLLETSFRHTPPLCGAIEYVREGSSPLTLGVLHGYVVNEGNAWGLTLDALSQYFERALSKRADHLAAPESRRPLLELAAEDVPPLAQELISSYVENVRLLGQRTAELHTALASASGDSAFTPEPFTTLYQRSLYQSLRTQGRQTFEALRKQLRSLPDEVREVAQAVLSRETDYLKQSRGILERKITAQRIRCHGDYHLGQLLFTGKDFVIIDLEGDRGRPFSERRRKRSPLRDVASMLRSFHYAALVALRRGSVRPEDAPTLGPWIDYWYAWVSAVFLRTYLEVARRASFLPENRADIQALLDYYLLRRAVNELRYELVGRNRVKIPLEGLLQLLQVRA